MKPTSGHLPEGVAALTDSSVIRVMCPNLVCQRVLAVPPHARGKLVRCRNCGTTVRIPSNKPAPKDAAPQEGAASGKSASKPASK